MTDLSRMMDMLYADVEWQRLPVVMNEMARRKYLSQCQEVGIETLFIATGRASAYDRVQLEWDTEGMLCSLSEDLILDERRYVMLSAKIEFFRKVQTDVNNIVGYTTDALTVTNADKPYINLDTTITKLEKERRMIHYKMIRHTLL